MMKSAGHLGWHLTLLVPHRRQSKFWLPPRPTGLVLQWSPQTSTYCCHFVARQSGQASSSVEENHCAAQPPVEIFLACLFVGGTGFVLLLLLLSSNWGWGVSLFHPCFLQHLRVLCCVFWALKLTFSMPASFSIFGCNLSSTCLGYRNRPSR